MQSFKGFGLELHLQGSGYHIWPYISVTQQGVTAAIQPCVSNHILAPLILYTALKHYLSIALQQYLAYAGCMLGEKKTQTLFSELTIIDITINQELQDIR
jgi:hypothetical protein